MQHGPQLGKCKCLQGWTWRSVHSAQAELPTSAGSKGWSRRCWGRPAACARAAAPLPRGIWSSEVVHSGHSRQAQQAGDTAPVRLIKRCALCNQVAHQAMHCLLPICEQAENSAGPGARGMHSCARHALPGVWLGHCQTAIHVTRPIGLTRSMWFPLALRVVSRELMRQGLKAPEVRT